MEVQTMSVENIQAILNYVLAIGPSVVSIITMVLSIIINIKKQGKLNSSQMAAIDTLASEIRGDIEKEQEDNKKTKALLRCLIKENSELKSRIDKLVEKESQIAEVKHE
jgi:hypothetical protein